MHYEKTCLDARPAGGGAALRRSCPVLKEIIYRNPIGLCLADNFQSVCNKKTLEASLGPALVP